MAWADFKSQLGKQDWGGIGSTIGGLFGSMGNENPMDVAMPFLNQGQQFAGALPGQLGGIFGPFMQNAQSMYGPLSGQLSALMSNPGQVLNQMGQAYSASPGYEWMKSQALQAGQQAANAGGMAGTPMNQQSQMQLASQLANQDYYNYLNHAQNLYGAGLQGAQGIYGGGLQAAGQFGQGLSGATALQAELASQQAQLAAQAQQNQNAQNSATGSGWGDIFGTAVSMLPFLFL